MDIQIDSRVLGRALRMTAAVANGKTKPILGNVLLCSDGKTLTATATNLEVTTSVRCDTSGTDGVACVDAKKLAELAKHIPHGVVRIHQAFANKPLEVSFGRSRFAFQCAVPYDFPTPTDSAGVGIAIKRADLLDLLKGTLYAASHDETRAALGCVRLGVVDGKSLAVTTDGHRLAIVTRDCHGAAEPVSIDRGGAAEMVRALEDCAEDKVSLRVSDKDVVLVAGDTIIRSRLLDLLYPAWRQVVPGAWAIRATLPRSDLVQAVTQVMCVADRGNRVAIECRDGAITFRGANPAIGECSASVPIDSNVAMATAVNGAYFMDAIRHVTGDAITIACNDPLSPIGVWGSDMAAEIMIVMPTR